MAHCPLIKGGMNVAKNTAHSRAHQLNPIGAVRMRPSLSSILTHVCATIPSLGFPFLNEFCCAVDVELGIKFCPVSFHGPCAYAQLFGNFLVGLIG